jgi:hypothetical protein
MSQSGQSRSSSGGGGGGSVTSVTGANGVTASPTTGAVIVSGINATTSTVGVASFNPTDFTVSGAGEVSAIAMSSGITTIDGDTGSITGSTVTIFANNASLGAGQTILFNNSGTTSTLQVSDADNNTIFGKGAGKAGLTGVQNTVFGAFSLTGITTGNANTGFGYDVFHNVTSGTNNTGFGNSVLGAINTGSYNLGLGNISGSNYTSSESSNILLLNSGVAGESNVIRIGTQGTGTGQQSKCFVAGINGNTLGGTPSAVTIDTSTGQLGVAAFPSSSISITGNTGGALTGNAFTFTGGTTGLTFAGLGTTETLGGTLAIANGGTNATSYTQSNGIVTYNGTRLVNYAGPQLSSGGVMTNTTQPAFSAYLNSTQSNIAGDGTLATIIFDTPRFDNTSSYNTSTGIFTAPVAGNYFFTALIFAYTTSVFTECDIFLTKNASTYQLHTQTQGVIGAATTLTTNTMTGIIPLAANDTIKVQMNAYTVANTKNVSMLGLANGAFNAFSGYLLPA